jgi:hypothetical protein
MMEQPFERTVEAFLFDEAPGGVPRDLHDAIVDRARATAQRRAVLRHWPPVGRSRRMLLLAAAVLAIGAPLALGVGGPAPVPVTSPTPRTSPATESVPSSAVDPARSVADLGRLSFSYVIPDGQAGRDGDLAFIWARGGDELWVTVLTTLRVHPCDGPGDFIEIRTDAAGLFEDLRTISHARLGPSIATSVDGRPALRADYSVDPTCGIDLHDSPSHLAQPFMVLRHPAQFTALDVGGQDVLIIVFSSDADALSGWLPVAQRFIDSIQFTP